jgi:hypothetical protein
MTILTFNNLRLKINSKFLNLNLPSESPALIRMQNFITSLNAYIVDYNELPPNQGELEGYMSFSPEDNYTFLYIYVNNNISYFNAQSNNNLIHSYTRTVAFDTSLSDIICKKLGTVPPGVANYQEGILSCQIGTIKV